MSEEQAQQIPQNDTSENKTKPHKPKDKIKFNKTFKIKKHSNSHNKQAFIPFNDPLYQYLDNEVTNKQQHNFGPWIQSQKKLTRQKIKRQSNQIVLEQRPHYVQRIQSNEIRYQEQQPDLFAFPIIMQRNRIPSLQQIKHSSIQFHFQQTTANHSLKNNRDPYSYRKNQFFNKMQGIMMHKIRSQLQISDKKSAFNYNYCVVQENQNESPLKNKLSQLKHNRYKAQSYLKLNSEAQNKLINLQNKIKEIQKSGRNNNQLLLQEIKRHKINKLK